ncbi:alkylhydroperoxidase [Rhodocyclaceae bacterium]|nr:alkylhydroperoxidase [Rhodocyclaceae bacterium]
MLAERPLNLNPLTLDTAPAKGRALLEQAQKNLGFIPNMYARMVNSPGLLETYLTGYAAFRNESGFTPAEQEVVFLVISQENGCEYCVSAHSFIADKKSALDPAVTDAIRAGEAIADPRLAALAAFTRTMVAKRGLPAASEMERFLAAGYTERHVLEIVLAIAVKTLSNYANHLFHTPLDPVFADRKWTDPRV